MRMVTPKKWWRSRTVWIDLAALLIILIQWLAGIEVVDLKLQASIVIGVNLVLRFITNTGIAR